MKNLDLSIGNQGILDESFSNFTSSDVISIRDKIKEVESKLDLLNSSPFKDLFEITSTTNFLNQLKSQLAAIPKSIVDAVDNQVKLQQQLSEADKNKLTAAEIAAIEKQNRAIQEAIDKSKGVTDILSGKTVTTDVPVSPDYSMPSGNKTEQNTTAFTTKNIVIATSILAVLSIGIYLLIKK